MGADPDTPKGIRTRLLNGDFCGWGRDFGALLTLIRSHALLHQASRSRDHHGRVVATLDDYADGMSLPQLAKELDIDKSAAARRWQSARRRGYLKNEETRKGRPAPQDRRPAPDDVEILPSVARLAQRCSVAGVQEGIPAPPPPAVRTKSSVSTAEPKSGASRDPSIRRCAPDEPGSPANARRPVRARPRAPRRRLDLPRLPRRRPPRPQPAAYPCRRLPRPTPEPHPRWTQQRPIGTSPGGRRSRGRSSRSRFS